MKPQELDLNCELFNQFREALDGAIKTCMRELVSRRLTMGTIIGKIEIRLEEYTTEDGELMFQPVFEPDVSMKIGAKGKIDCRKETALMKCDGGNGFIVGTNQVSMDELLQGGEGDEHPEGDGADRPAGN